MCISFLIPALDERRTMLELLERIEALGLDRQLFVLDDGSTGALGALPRAGRRLRTGCSAGR